MDNNGRRLENNARRMWPEIALFSIRSSLFSTFATVGTGHLQKMKVQLYAWISVMGCIAKI